MYSAIEHSVNMALYKCCILLLLLLLLLLLWRLMSVITLWTTLEHGVWWLWLLRTATLDHGVWWWQPRFFLSSDKANWTELKQPYRTIQHVFVSCVHVPSLAATTMGRHGANSVLDTLDNRNSGFTYIGRMCCWRAARRWLAVPRSRWHCRQTCRQGHWPSHSSLPRPVGRRLQQRDAYRSTDTEWRMIVFKLWPPHAS